MVFAKNNSHADDIIQTVRQEFAEGNNFCRKITYKTQNPKLVLTEFRNSFNPRIAVTVDMISTGTDIKPLECLLFMRDVKSRNYFEQMKGRGTRTLGFDDLRKVSSSAKSAKTHYVIVDAVGVTKSLKTGSQPLITEPNILFKDLAMEIILGNSDENIVSSFVGRLARLDRQLNDADRKKIEEQSGGVTINQIINNLLTAIDIDNVHNKAKEFYQLTNNEEPNKDQIMETQSNLVSNAAKVITGKFIALLEDIRRNKEQIIIHNHADTLTHKGWDGSSIENAKNLTNEFQEYFKENRDDIEALTAFYSNHNKKKKITYDTIRKLAKITLIFKSIVL